MCNSILGKTEKLGLRRPKTGPIELKNATGKTPILDGGALSHIKSGNIKVKQYTSEPNVPNVSEFCVMHSWRYQFI